MEKSQFKKYSIWFQVAAWLLLFLVLFMADLTYLGGLYAAAYALNVVLTQMVLVYLHYYLIFPLFHQGKKLLYFSLAAAFIALGVVVSFYADIYVLIEGYEESEDNETLLEYFSYIFPISVLIVSGSTAYYFIQAWYNNIKKESLLKNQKLEAELNFLKSQINPHFLFNTLNNIYSYVQTGNEKSAPMLERLSSVLRFMVYECTEEKVELSKELEAVDDLLEIYKMKNSGQRNITLEMNGVKGFHLIAPLIIVNLVENACKHSDAVSNAKGFIRVVVKVDEQDVCNCEVSNSIKTNRGMETKYGGVGHENVVKRLELQYGDAYTLEKQQESGNYYLKVSMPLERKI